MGCLFKWNICRLILFDKALFIWGAVFIKTLRSTGRAGGTGVGSGRVRYGVGPMRKELRSQRQALHYSCFRFKDVVAGVPRRPDDGRQLLTTRYQPQVFGRVLLLLVSFSGKNGESITCRAWVRLKRNKPTANGCHHVLPQHWLVSWADCSMNPLPARSFSDVGTVSPGFAFLLRKLLTNISNSPSLVRFPFKDEPVLFNTSWL